MKFKRVVHAALCCLLVGLVAATGCGEPGGAGDPETEPLTRLIAQLRRGLPEERLAAARELGGLKAERAVPALIEALHDSQLGVRLAAAGALGEIGSPRATPALVVVLRDGDPQVRKAAASALGETADPSAMEALLAGLDDPELTVRFAVGTALGRFGDAALPPLMQRLKEGNPDARSAAAFALARIQDPRSTDALLAALNDEHLNVRRFVAEALGMLRDDRAVETLVGLMQQPLRPEDVKRFEDRKAQPPGEDLARQIAERLLQQRMRGGGLPAGTLPHQADKRKKELDSAIEEIQGWITPPLTDAKRAIIEAIIVDRIGAESFAEFSPEQRQRAVERETEHLRELITPPLSSQSEGQISDILANRAARQWWAGLSERQRADAIRREYVRPIDDEMRHSAAEMRRVAGRALATIASPKAVTALLTAAKSADREVREIAQASFEEMGRAAIEPLGKMALDKNLPAPTRAQAMTILSGLADARDVDIFLAALKSDLPELRQPAVETLAKHPDPRAAGALIGVLTDGDNAMRVHAARALGRIGDTRAVEALIAALRDAHEPVRQAAAVSLGELRDTRAADPLLAILRNPGDIAPGTLAAVCQALGRLKEPRAVDLLIPLLASRERAERPVVEAAARALGQIGDRKAVEPLIGLYAAHHYRGTHIAAESLGELGDPRAVEPLLKYITGNVSGMMQEVAPLSFQALGKIRDPATVEALLGVLEGGAPERRRMAAQALIQQADLAVPALVKTLSHRDKEFRGQAAQLLGHIGRPAMEALLEFVANPPSTDALSAAIYPLSRIPESPVIEALAKLLTHDNAEIRANAAWALGELADARVIEPLQRALQDADPRVRRAAEVALEKARVAG
jgi:HEAT repeat protein